jgi:hypothetical protein
MLREITAIYCESHTKSVNRPTLSESVKRNALCIQLV